MIMTCNNYLAMPELSKEEKTFFESTKSDAKKALALIKEQLAAHTSPANLKQDLRDLQAQIKTAKPLLAAIKSGTADEKAMETVSGLLVAVDNWLSLVAMTPAPVQAAFEKFVAQLAGNKVVLTGLFRKVQPDKYPPTYKELTERFKDSFSIFVNDISTLAKSLEDSENSITVLINYIGQYDFFNVLVDTEGEVKLQVSLANILLTDGPPTTDFNGQTFSQKSTTYVGYKTPWGEDGMVDNPGLPEDQRRVIGIEILDPSTKLPTGKYFWIVVWLQVLPHN